MTEFFQHEKLKQLRSRLWSFQQHKHETFLDAWERFQELRRRSVNPLIEGGENCMFSLMVSLNSLKAIMNQVPEDL